MNEQSIERLLHDPESEERKTLYGLARGLVFPVNRQCKKVSERMIGCFYGSRVENVVVKDDEMFAVFKNDNIRYFLYVGDVPDEHRDKKRLPQIVRSSFNSL